MIVDNHVHIGQWNDLYFSAEDVFKVLKENGIDECYFSSTTSCVMSKSISAGNDTVISPLELYESIKDEVKNALDASCKIGMNAHALYWVVPDIVRAGVSIEKAMSEVKYDGFKIHPRAQVWQNDEIAESVFDYAQSQNLRIMIHTGIDDDVDNPKKFEPLIKKYSSCMVQLAHLKDLDSQEYMLKTYPNVVVDSSFSGQSQVDALVSRGIDKNRILWGSDFPVNFYFALNFGGLKIDPITIAEMCKFYKKDLL